MTELRIDMPIDYIVIYYILYIIHKITCSNFWYSILKFLRIVLYTRGDRKRFLKTVCLKLENPEESIVPKRIG